MKPIANTKRTAARRGSAILLSVTTLAAVLLLCTSCTDGGNVNPSDTGSGNASQTENGTAKPMDPQAGTVNPDGDSGNPPAGTEGGTGGSRFGGDFMH